ncbi:MAG: hypothetical protein KAS16_06820 [Thermoplasmata archaeon]|nr:hypothetical protein [Thermoplasmata archaeon]
MMKYDTEDIMNHLLFHKAIIKENDEDLDIDNYMSLLHKLDEGMHVVIEDPVEKAVAIAFQLVMESKFDPWDLDLVEFTRIYLKRINQEEDVNFIIAGRLILMAWSVLKMQSDKVLMDADRPNEVEDYFFDGWDVMEQPEEPSSAGYFQTVLECETPLIQEAVRNTSTRQISLMSLLEAFDEARQEIELRKLVGKHFDEPDITFSISENMHVENLEENISITWQRICHCDQVTVPITQVWNNEPMDRVRVFVSSLFLAKMKKITLNQRSLPYGEIMIKNIEDIESPIEMVASEVIATDTIDIEPQPEGESISLEELAVV